MLVATCIVAHLFSAARLATNGTCRFLVNFASSPNLPQHHTTHPYVRLDLPSTSASSPAEHAFAKSRLTGDSNGTNIASDHAIRH